jgi:hypothetical protein
VERDGFRHSKMDAVDDKRDCLLMHRCRLVYNTAGSSLVNAILVHVPGVELGPERIGDIQLYGDALNYQQLLQYKAIIMLEGNDVSTGLKWALYSNSVVMMQPPTKTSWIMEEMLEPWVHYIPLNKNLSDVEEKMQWVIDHDEKAQVIARRGALWIKDLLLHPDTEKEDERIYDEILRRYWKHFVQQDDLSLEQEK